MSILTYLTQAEIRDAQIEMDGKVLSRPALLVTDGKSHAYACDVDIGQDEPLRAVPIAAGNHNVAYAAVGSAVRLRRSEAGRYEIIGFAKTMPGTRTRIPVAVATRTVGSPQSVGWSARPLAYDELGTYGGYGVLPYGATAIYQGDTLKEIK